MTKQTINAIQKRISNREDRFYIGEYYYEFNLGGVIRRRKQAAGRTPTTDWERIDTMHNFSIPFCGA